MTFKQFEDIIKTLEKEKERTQALYKLGVDLNEYNDNFLKIIDVFLYATFGQQGSEWIYWYLYERKDHTGKILTAHDSNGKEICNDLKSLWETVWK